MKYLLISFIVLFILRVIFLGVQNPLLQYVIPFTLIGLAIVILISSEILKLYFFKKKYFVYFVFFIGLLVFSLGISQFNNKELIFSLTDVFKFLTMNSIFVVFFYTGWRGHIIGVNRALVSLVFLHVLIGVVGYFIGLGREFGGIYRPYGIIGSVNVLANLALFSSAFFGAKAILARKMTFSMIIFLFSLILVFLSATLKNVLVLCALPVLYVLMTSKKPIKSLFYIIIIVIPTLVLLAITTPVLDRLNEALVAGVSLNVTQGDQLESSAQWRILHWSLLLKDWYFNFFWQGAGVGQVTQMNALKTASGDGYNAHSDFVGFFVELGPLLFLGFLFFQLYIVKYLYKNSQNIYSKNYINFNALFYSFLAMFFAMSFGPVVYSLAYFYIFWAFLGLIIGDEYRVKK
jgi:hypothetical protein